MLGFERGGSEMKGSLGGGKGGGGIYAVGLKVRS